MPIRQAQAHSPKLFLFAILSIALLVGASPLWTAHSAGNSSGGQFRFAPSGDRNVTSAQDPDKAKSRHFGNLDVRVNGTGASAKLARVGSPAVVKSAQAQSLAIQKGLSRLKATVPSVDAKLSPITGAVEVLRSANSLTGPHPGRNGTDIVREFIEANNELYGLTQGEIDNLNFIGESVNQVSGLRMVRVEQVVNGLPVFQSETRFMLDRDGRVVRSTGLMIPQAGANAPSLGNLLSAPEALRSAMAALDISLDVNQMTLTEKNAEGTKAEVVANAAQISGNVPSKLVYFPLAPGVLIPAWSQITFTNGDADWYTLVDATNGELLWRKNIRNYVSTHEARFSVYVQADGKTPADSPAPQSPTSALTGGGTQFPEILRTTVNMLTVQNILASPNGWINDCPGGGCTAAETQTIGNNVHAYMDAQGGANNNLPDTNAAFMLDGNGKPTGNLDAGGRNRDFLGAAPRDYTGFLPPPQGGNPEAGQTATGNGNNGTLAIDSFRRGVVTQLFYVCNWYHDQLFVLGFDEAAGNFQQTNFSGLGVGNDRVLAEAEDNISTNNANFSTPPDGTSGRAQMFRFTGPTIDRDGDLDSEVLVHELTHGTSNRLIGNAAGLNWDAGGGMGEGWSDFYALSLLNNTNADDPNGKYAAGAYATYKINGLLDNYVYGIRRFPYSTNNSINPMTWADVDDTTTNYSGGIPISPLGIENNGGGEVHNIGEIWCLTLWEVRSRIIAANANDVPTGNTKMLSIVTDGLKMTPLSPSFVEARNALIDADCAANACANEQSIWDGFADRGLGYNAIAPIGYSFANIASHQGIGESFFAPYLDVQSVAVDDALGNNNGRIDPGESIRIFVTLKNPWRNAAKGVASATATLSSSTAGVVITDPNSAYPAIAASGNAAGDQFRFNVPSGAACGQSLKFTITPTSTLGNKPVDFVLRVGSSAGPGAPITYTRTPGALAIPDFNPLGVIDSLTVTDDFEIMDLNFRIDSITHTFPGDLNIMLRAPNGLGNDMIAFLGAAIGAGNGNNMTNMVIDDAGPGDQLLATDAQAPYTQSWFPAFNSPTWPLVGFGPQDPVGELGRFNGMSTQGTWKILASDQFSVDTGTLNSWSIIVTPRAFACSLPVPTAADSTISGQISDSNGSPLAGVVINLSGTQSRRTITDENGIYRFENVETNGFYTVTPFRANYSFGPASRSFSQLGNTTQAVFTGTPNPVIVGNAIETPEYFVRQQYLDFLGREPDESGFNFWSSEINSCGNDRGCVERKRINVSAAFFLSIEFQQTGYEVYRLYKAAYGNLPGAPVPVRLSEFRPDAAEIGNGVVVNRNGWEQQLEINKQGFASEFVQRGRFISAYPTTLTPAQFVDQLFANTGVTPSGDERTAAISEFGSASDTSDAAARGRALRRVAENATFAQQESNQAFVLMQYFGYLRRDPNSGPDTDFSGYNFWLNKLNTFGNYQDAEMVKAFLVSGEYRSRFPR